MGTKVECKSYLPGFHSMRDLNEDSNSCSWPLYYGDKTFRNGQYYNGFLPRVVADAYPGYDKDVVKRTMLEHETIFRNQVYELHRLYRTQRDLMDAIKRKELHKNWVPVETSLTSSPLASQITSEGARKWHMRSFPLANSICGRSSVSGAEDNHSSFSSIKGNTVQAVSLPYQNGGTSKDIEVLESRPTKFRRKMLDLQLPADEYIDTEEVKPSREEKDGGLSSYLTNGNSTNAPESSAKLFHGDADKTGCVRSVNGLADLNKPIQIEETNSSTCVELLGHPSCDDKIRGQELSGKPSSHFLGLPKDMSLNSNHQSNNGRLNSLQLENNGNGSGWFSHVLEVELGKNNLTSVSQGLQQEKMSVSSQPIQDRSSKEHEPPFLHRADQSNLDHPWWERANGGFEISNYNHPESVVVPRMRSLYPVAPSSDMEKSWSHSVSCSENPNSSLTQKSISDQMHPYINSSATLSKSSRSSTQGNGNFSDRWHLNSNFRSNPGFVSEFPYRNGFYHGSSSGSKLSVPLPSISYDYLNCSNDNVAYEHFMNQGSTKHNRSSNCLDVNLNVALSNSVSSEVAPLQCLGIVDSERKHDDHLAVLSWLRPNSAWNKATNVGKDSNLKNSIVFQSSPHQISNISETRKGVITNQIFPQKIKLLSSSDEVDAKRIGIGDCPSDKKILGFTIFEKHRISKPAVSIHHPSEGGVAETNRKIGTLDINLPCDLGVPDLSKQVAAEVQVIEKQTNIKAPNFRHDIDLNSCISEDEDFLISSVPITKVNVMTGIDLEAPLIPEPEEDGAPLEALEKQHEGPLPQQIPEELQKELETVAAEAIVAISSSVHKRHLNDITFSQSEASTPGPLHWFVEVVSSFGDDLYSKFEPALIGKDVEDNEESSLEDVDYFESMTLKLTETREEEYMPNPSVPENLLLDESGVTPVPTRPRRGQARRGRQRRDFQRDILPGLTSLSRHEVTEDLQTFGGMMQATGHSWNFRNSCARGRRRRAVVSPSPTVASSPTRTPLVQQLNNIEVGLEDRSLTGWGKTTRRPRRQRCPAGNPPLLPST